MGFQFGIDNLLGDTARLKVLNKARVGLVAHPASVTGSNEHAIDALMKAGCNIVRAFGPQHGMRGEKQDNMIESEDYQDQTENCRALHRLTAAGAGRRIVVSLSRAIPVVDQDAVDVRR